MRALAEAWPEGVDGGPLAAIWWYQHVTLLDKLASAEERRWYAAQAVERRADARHHSLSESERAGGRTPIVRRATTRGPTPWRSCAHRRAAAEAPAALLESSFAPASGEGVNAWRAVSARHVARMRRLVSRACAKRQHASVREHQHAVLRPMVLENGRSVDFAP
jgi:hypothetical protein